jgi:hypothetical protein
LCLRRVESDNLSDNRNRLALCQDERLQPGGELDWLLELNQMAVVLPHFATPDGYSGLDGTAERMNGAMSVVEATSRSVPREELIQSPGSCRLRLPL